MNPRSTTLAAVAVSVSLVAGIAAFVLGRRPPPIRLIILSQKVDAKSPAAEAIVVGFLPPQELSKADPDDDEHAAEYRVVDRNGRTYASTVTNSPEPLWLSIPRTYVKHVDRPRLLALIDGKPRASADLAPFPPPALRSLDARPDSRICARHEIRSIYEQAFGRESGFSPVSDREVVVVFRPIAPIPKDEYWAVSVLGTNIALGRATGDQSYPIASDRPELLFGPSYAEDIQAAQVRIVRFRRTILSGDVVVHGLRLTEKGGRLVFDLPKPVPIVNSLGIQLTVKSDTPVAAASRFSPALHFDALGGIPVLPYVAGPDAPFEVSAGDLTQVCSIQLLGPLPQELGLDNIGPLTARLEQGRYGRRSLPKGSFDLRLRLTKIQWKSLGTFEATIPVGPTP